MKCDICGKEVAEGEGYRIGDMLLCAECYASYLDGNS